MATYYAYSASEAASSEEYVESLDGTRNYDSYSLSNDSGDHNQILSYGKLYRQMTTFIGRIRNLINRKS